MNKKLLCNIELFNLNQNIYTVDIDTGDIDLVATTTLDSIVKTISILSHTMSISNISLIGSIGFGEQIAKDIIEYSKTNYDNNINLEIEVK